MSRLTRDGTAEPVSRDQILRHARGQGNVHFPCSADHEQDWQPYPVDPYSAICDDHTYPGSCLRCLPTCGVRHSHHASTSPSSTIFLTHVCPPRIPPLLASGPSFSAAAVSQLCHRRHGCRGKRFRFVGVHHRQSMLLAGHALSASKSSCVNPCHEGTLIDVRTL